MMRAPLLTPCLLGAALLGAALPLGCARYDFEVSVSLPSGYQAADYSFTTSVYAPGAASAIRSCADFAWGEHTPDDLSEALVGSANPELAASKIDVPRVGDKLVVVEATSRTSGEVALFGCAEHGDIEDEVVVEVVLEPTARLALEPTDRSLTLALPFTGGADVDPPLLVRATGADGEPVAMRVRVRVLDGQDEVVQQLGDDGELATDDDGELVLDLHLETFGPFRIEVEAMRPLGEPPEPVPGFGVPQQTAVFPFGPETEVYSAYPLPLGPRQMAYAAFIEGTGPLGLPRFVFALPEPVPGGLPTFEVVEPDGLVGRMRASVGLVYDPALDENRVLSQAESDGSLWSIRPTEAELLMPGGFVVEPNGRNGPVTLGDLTLDFAFPAGPCEEHYFASPLLVVMSVPAGQDQTVEINVLVDPLQTPPRSVNLGQATAQVRGSVCLGAPDGTLHRVLLTRARATNLRGAIDLGGGLLPDDLLDFDPAEVDGFLSGGVPVLGALKMATTGGDEANLLVAVIGGFEVEVNELPLADDQALFGPSSYLYAIPGVPAHMGSAPLTAPGVRVDYHVIGTSSDDEEDRAPALLYLVAGDFSSGDVQPGGLTLQSCFNPKQCGVMPADIDGDGVYELYSGRTVAYPAAYEDVKVMTEVVKLSP